MSKQRELPKKTISYIKAALRRIWGWDTERKRAKARAAVGSSYKCEACAAQPLGRKEVQIDHVLEVDNAGHWDGWSNYIERLFVGAEGLMILCLPCHKAKTTANNAIRRKARKANK